MSALSMALTGNPNSGKTTLFNSITGAHRHVGNYPGITVEKHELSLKVGNRDVRLLDLPGTYSLSAYSAEEAVVRQTLSQEPPQVVIDVCNAGALERHLYLALQLLEMGCPLVLALNMMDEAEAAGIHIDAELLSSRLGIPVVPCVGRTGKNVPQVLEKALDVARGENACPTLPLHINYGLDVEEALEAMGTAIREQAFLKDTYHSRWTALKFLEGDSEVRSLCLEQAPDLARWLEVRTATLARHLKDTLDTSIEGLLADCRHGYITSLLRGVVHKRQGLHARHALTAKLDNVLLNRLLGPVIMLSVLWLTYEMTLSVGEIPKGWLEGLFGWLGDSVSALMPEGLFRSLVVSGIIDGVGSVLSFVPLIFILFMVIAILDDTGYMARMAHMLDRIFRSFGLHGCSVMPYVVSGGIPGGCAIPGIMATRTLRSPRERLATMLTAPFMACGAKVPVFLLLVSVFFPARLQSTMLFGLTLAGWGVALLAALVLRKTVLRGEPTPFVLELPPYRMPTLRGVLLHAWERTWMYMRKAGTVILAISVLLWAAMTFPGLPEDKAQDYAQQREHIAATASTEQKEDLLAALSAEEAQENLRHSVAGRVGLALEPVTSMAGFDWRTNIALLAGIAAKEVVVSTLGTAYSLGEVDPEEAAPLSERLATDPDWNAARALALMLFVLLYAPCFVSVVVLRQESGSWGWALLPVVGNTLLAYGVAVAVYQGMRWMGW